MSIRFDRSDRTVLATCDACHWREFSGQPHRHALYPAATDHVRTHHTDDATAVAQIDKWASRERQRTTT